MVTVRFRGRDWVRSILLDSNFDPGSRKHVLLGKLMATVLRHRSKSLVFKSVSCFKSFCSVKCMSLVKTGVKTNQVKFH